jgi:cytochrome oxidase Cu insertion factor (SCO1/SenC/PrrC family)
MAKEKSAGRLKVAFAFALLFGPAFILLFLGTRGCEHKFKELDDYGVAHSYSFKDQAGNSYSHKDFKDKVVLIANLQVTCPDSCAISVWHLDQLIYQKIRKNKNEIGSVRIISFVSDENGNPVEDVSSVSDMLNDLVEGYDPEVWIVAKGSPKEIYDIESNGENLLREDKSFYAGKSYTELMLLLDRNNHLRMATSGKKEGYIRRMYEHIALLLKQYDKQAASK